MLGKVMDEIDGVPDVLVAQFIGPWLHDHRLGTDAFLDAFEDLRVGATVLPFAGDQVGRGRTLWCGRTVALALQPVATRAVLCVESPSGLDRIRRCRNGVFLELEAGCPERELNGRSGGQAIACDSDDDIEDGRATVHGPEPLFYGSVSPIYCSVPD